MLITIRHKLTIDFKGPVQRLLFHLLMSPQSGPTQKVVDWTLDIPGEAKQVPMIDGFGNKALFASLTNVEEPLDITVSGTVETLSSNGVLGWPMGEPVPWLYHRATPATRVPVSVWGKFRSEAAQRDSQLGAMHGLMERIHDMLNARNEAEAAEAEQGQSQSQASEAGSQSQSQSQDEPDMGLDPALEYAGTFVGSARALGIPARFVSGYYLAGPDEDIESGAHAWAEAYVEGLGWIAFDPRLDLCPTDRHVRVAVGLDAESAVAIRAYPSVGDETVPVETVEISVAAEPGR